MLESLNIDLKVVLINIVGFVLLWLVAKKLVFTPIGKVIEERQQDIATTYNKIDADRATMEETRRQYEGRLAKIEEERRETVQRAINEAQQTRDQIVHEAASRAQEMTSRAEQEVAREREQALISLRREVVDLALGAATKVIGDNLDESRQRRLIDDFIISGTASGGTGTTGSSSVTGTASVPPVATAEA